VFYLCVKIKKLKMNYLELLSISILYITSFTIIGFVVAKDRKEYKKFYKIKN
tara:strand:- start:12304 stop:12459 length:156 start_codon:yes stop_codon:yes gene_type:complete